MHELSVDLHLTVQTPCLTLDAPNQPGSTYDEIVFNGEPTAGSSEADLLYWKEVLLFHMVPPNNEYEALWTTPFLTSGLRLNTQLHVLLGDRGVDRFLDPMEVGAGLTLKASGGEAAMSDTDIEVCKGFINKIDTVLLPYEAPSADPYLTPLEIPSVCDGQFGANYKGDVLQQGGEDGTIVEDAGACCMLCSKNAQCNVWVFCGTPGGCGLGDATSFEFGLCTLKNQAELGTEDEAAVFEEGLWVPWISGTVRSRAGVSG